MYDPWSAFKVVLLGFRGSSAASYTMSPVISRKQRPYEASRYSKVKTILRTIMLTASKKEDLIQTGFIKVRSSKAQRRRDCPGRRKMADIKTMFRHLPGFSLTAAREGTQQALQPIYLEAGTTSSAQASAFFSPRPGTLSIKKKISLRMVGLPRWIPR